MKRIRYAVEYQAPGLGGEFWETQETDSPAIAQVIEHGFHEKGIVARIIERTTTERYLGKHD